MLRPLGLSAQQMDFVVPDPSSHAQGYLAKYSFMNLIRGFVTDPVWEQTLSFSTQTQRERLKFSKLIKPADQSR